MKELFTRNFWDGVKKTFDEAQKEPPPAPKPEPPKAEEPAAIAPEAPPQ